MAKTPRIHQREAIAFFNQCSERFMGSLFWHGMGLGKTLSALWIARNELSKARQAGARSPKFLVIAPKSARVTWKVECNAETPDLNRDMIIIPYSQLHKADRLLEYADVRLIVFDESHYLKAIDTDRMRSLVRFLTKLNSRTNNPYYGKMLMLTGTPMPNNAGEFYTTWAMLAAGSLTESISRLTDHGAFERWREAFSHIEEKSWTTGQGDKKRSHYAVSHKGVRNEDMLNQLIAPITHFRRVEDCIDLPKYQIIPIDIGHDDDKLLKDVDVNRPDAYMSLVETLSRAKAPYMYDWVRDFFASSNEQLVVFSQFTTPLYELERKFKGKFLLITGQENDAERTRNIRRFQNGEVQGIAMSYGAGSESLNFQNAYHTLYHGYPWNWAKFSQAMARTYRQGQEKATFHHVIFSGQSDINLFNNVMDKKHATEKVQDLILQTNNSAVATLDKFF